MSNGFGFRNEFNWAHVVSFAGSLLMVGVMWGTTQAQLSTVREQQNQDRQEHAEFRQKLLDLTTKLVEVTTTIKDDHDRRAPFLSPRLRENQ